MAKKTATNLTVASPRLTSSALVDSHYVKVMLDQIVGENNFQNEIVWN
jgi:hypothetical protein